MAVQTTDQRSAGPAEGERGEPGDGQPASPRGLALRVGVDVGGTFTKAVAIEAVPFSLRAQSVVPTTHGHADGVMAGVAEALTELLGSLGSDRKAVQLVAFSTTQAMNALLEGDVPRIGIVGIGRKPDLRRSRRRTQVGSIALAPGRALETSHEFLDATHGLTDERIEAALDRLEAAGCEALAISGAYSVEEPEQELAVAARAAARELPVCCGHELSEAYGLETRTVSAAINAAILPVIARTGGLVESALGAAGLDVPLLVLRGDGGAMDVASFRRRPSLTVGSGPAAGVAAALHRAGVSDAIVVECGGTSTNVSVVVRGRPVLRSIRVMGRPTAIRSIDSWVVGMAGGSMIRVSRRGIAGTGPRSAHVAGLEYACFADPADLDGAEVELISPVPGDPAVYATLVTTAAGETKARRWALTATCAANALGLVAAGEHAHAGAAAATAGFEALAAHLGHGDAREVATGVLDAGLAEIRIAVEEAARAHGLGDEIPLLSLGGAGAALVPELGRRMAREVIEPDHQEVLASVGAATTLVRTEVVLSAGREEQASRSELLRAAERACVDAGAAPETVTVETSFDTREGLLRASASGAVALESGAADRLPAGDAGQLDAAARALGVDPGALERLSRSDFYAVFATPDSELAAGRRIGRGRGRERGRRVAVVDRLGSVPVVETVQRVVVGEGAAFEAEVAGAIAGATTNLGIASVIPKVTIACGPRLLDLSDSRRPEELMRAVAEALADHPGEATAVIAR